MATISHITLPDGTNYSIQATGIFYGEVDSTSTATVFTATIPGITEYYDGLTILLRNAVVTSTTNFTININNLGAKGAYSNMALGNPITPTNPTRETTIFNINYAMLFTYNSTIVSDGGWICYRGYDANTNTIGYQIRANNRVLKTYDKSRYYRLFFTSADGTHWVPANTGTDNSATSKKTVNQRPINPWGDIIYFSANTNLVAEADVAAGSSWQQYAFTLGYSFNTTGAALTLTTKRPVYIKCAPQTDGSAIIDSTTPYVQALPSTEDGKIYIFLGVAYSATAVELTLEHPVYYYKDNAIRIWTNTSTGSTVTVSQTLTSGTEVGSISVDGTSTTLYAPTPSTDENVKQQASTSNLEIPILLRNNKSASDGTSTEIVRYAASVTVQPSTGNLSATKFNNYTLAAASEKAVDSSIGAASTSTNLPTSAAVASFVEGKGYLTSAIIGAANGAAPLNASSKIDSTYLPSYVDDIIEGYYYNNKFWKEAAHTTEITGEAGKIYVDLSTNKTYRYSGSAFVEVSAGSLVTISRNLTNGTKSATINIDGTDYDIYSVNAIQPSTTNPVMDGTAAIGSSDKYARADHVHPSDTTKANTSTVPASASIASTGLITFSNSSSASLFTLQLPLYNGGVE